MLSIVASMVVLRPWSILREVATLVLCGDIGPKQMLDRLHVECADEEHHVSLLGMFSMALHRWENSFCLAAFIVVTVLFFSYMNRTNC